MFFIFSGLLSLIVLVNLCIMTCCYITGINLYQKYGKQILIFFAAFAVFIVAAYIVIALLGLN